MSNQAMSATSVAPGGRALGDAAITERMQSLLRMAVGEDTLSVPIERVKEILQVVRMTPLPRTPEFVRGVMNMRGAVVPVVDVAARLGRAHTEVGRRSCIVVVECHVPPEGDQDEVPKPFVVGLLVDAVYEVFDCMPGEIEPTPALGTRIPPAYLLGMTRARGALIGVLALDELLSPQLLMQAIQAHRPH